MSGKEWREVGRQSLYFFLALACVPLLLAGLADLLQGRPLDGEKTAIMAGLWLLVFSMFMGLSPFAMDAKQKGMEYLLTLPLGRRRLLWIKFLPRLATVVFFYLVYSFFYVNYGHAAFGSGFPFFSLIYFSLFLISFSLAVVDENFIVQSICAGIALSGYLPACLFIVGLGFSWKFGMPLSWTGTGAWQNLALDSSTLLVSVIVFLMMALPFILSLFLAFDRFDLKPPRAFNRRQLRIFIPLLLLAVGLSLGIAYLVQGRTPWWGSRVFLLGGQRALRAESPRKLTLIEGTSRRSLTTQAGAFWERLSYEDKGRLFLSGYDARGRANVLGRLDTADMSWSLLYRNPVAKPIDSQIPGFLHDGEGFVLLRQGHGATAPERKTRPAPAGTVNLELVCLGLDGALRCTLPFQAPRSRRNGHIAFLGTDQVGGERFWLVASPAGSVLRLWQDGRIDDLGPCRGMLPVFTRGLLFSRSEGGLAVRRLGRAGTDQVAEIPGRFRLDFAFRTWTPGIPLKELYAVTGGRIVRIDTATLAVSDVGPERGLIFLVAPGDFYYVEFESWPAGRATDAWKRIYRLQDGRMVLLREFIFGDAGYGHLMIERHGLVLGQHGNGGKGSAVLRRYFSFPDLEEIRLAGSE
jgi:hypothetical protein